MDILDYYSNQIKSLKNIIELHQIKIDEIENNINNHNKNNLHLEPILD